MDVYVYSKFWRKVDFKFDSTFCATLRRVEKLRRTRRSMRMSADRDKFANKNVIYGIYLKDGIGFMHQNMKQTFIAPLGPIQTKHSLCLYPRSVI